MALGGKREGAGRKKGSVNKRTLELSELLAKQCPGYNPVIQMAGIAQDEAIDVGIRLQAAKEVAQYLYPKRKAMEISSEQEREMPVVIYLPSNGRD